MLPAILCALLFGAVAVHDEQQHTDALRSAMAPSATEQCDDDGKDNASTSLDELGRVSPKLLERTKKVNASTKEPLYLGSLIAAGCTQGVIGGVAKFKSQTSVLSGEELRVVMGTMLGQLYEMQQQLDFRDDAKLEAWDFHQVVTDMRATIENITDSISWREFKSLSNFQRKVEPKFRVLFRNINEAHHVQFLSAGRDPCGGKAGATCTGAKFDGVIPSDLPAGMKKQFQKPCEMGQLIGRNGKPVSLCKVKQSLMVNPWKDGLTIPVCTDSPSDGPCLLVPDTDGQVGVFSQVVVQSQLCAMGNANSSTDALANMRAQDDAVASLLDNNAMFDTITSMKFGATAAVAMTDVAMESGKEGFSALRASRSFNTDVFAEFGVTKASAIVCQLAVANVLHVCPDLVQQVLVNAVQPVFSAAGKVIIAAKDAASGMLAAAGQFLGWGGNKSSAEEPVAAAADPVNLQTCTEANDALQISGEGMVTTDQLEQVEDTVNEVAAEMDPPDEPEGESGSSDEEEEDTADGDDLEQNSACTNMQTKHSLYSTRVKLGACISKLQVIGGRRGSEVVGLKALTRSHTIKCSLLNPDYEGEFYAKCYEDGPERYRGYRRLKKYIKKFCTEKQVKAKKKKANKGKEEKEEERMCGKRVKAAKYTLSKSRGVGLAIIPARTE